jgi:beta-xylosidase
MGTGALTGAQTGEPVSIHAKPALFASFAAPPATDEFEATELGAQWQWQANPGDDWASLKTLSGKLRLAALAPPVAGNLYDAPNLLMQKFPAPAFTATAKLDAAPDANDSQAALIVFGYDYAWIGVRQEAGARHLVFAVNRDAANGRPEDRVVLATAGSSPVWLRVAVDDGARCTFSYSSDGKTFVPAPGSFSATAGRWVGAKFGLFAVANGPGPTFADFDFVRVTP